MSEDDRPAGISRRRLLAGAGTAGAGLAAASAGILPGIRPAAARAAVTGAGAAGHSLPPGAPASWSPAVTADRTARGAIPGERAGTATVSDLRAWHCRQARGVSLGLADDERLLIGPTDGVEAASEAPARRST